MMIDLGTTIERMQGLVDGALPQHAGRFVLERTGRDRRRVLLGGFDGALHLHAGGRPVGHAKVSFRFRPDHPTGSAVADASTFSLFIDGERQPLIRFEYQESLTTTPAAHWHVHAERGAFSAMLTRTHGTADGRRDPRRLSSLHLPQGGPHFRVSLADFIEFLVEECGVDALPTWRRALHSYRAHWRRDEAATTARQFPAETAAALRALGWRVAPPVDDRAIGAERFLSA